jgi:uncharacterized membrane protein SirB2
MTYAFYKGLHIIGLALVCTALGGWVANALSGGTKESFKARKLMAILHGVGMLLLLVAGFGLIAKLHMSYDFNSWLGVKTVVWLALGALPAIVYRKANLAKMWLVCVLGLVGLAAYMAVYKPF